MTAWSGSSPTAGNRLRDSLHGQLRRQPSGISINDAIANTTVFNSNTSIDSIDSIRLDDLSENQRLEIFKRDFAATINAAAVEDDTTFIEEFIGCSLGSRKTNDPIFPLLVLPAMAGLALKRCQNASRQLV
ncbi:MAG: hypothetical protein WBN90_13695 [Gammaproteobacteria bacterium]